MTNGEQQEYNIKLGGNIYKFKADPGLSEQAAVDYAVKKYPQFAEAYSKRQGGQPHKAAMAPGTYQAFKGGPTLNVKEPWYREGIHGIESSLGINPKSVENSHSYGEALLRATGDVAKGAGKLAVATAKDPFAPISGLVSGVSSGVAGVEKGIKRNDPRAIAHGYGELIGLKASEKAVEAGGKLAGKAVSPIGSAARARVRFNQVADQAGHLGVKVDSIRSLSKAIEAEKLAKQGFNMPKPMSDFINRMKNWRQQGISLTYEEARNFEQALGGAIPWQDFGGKGGKMYGLAKAMRAILSNEIEGSLRKADPELADKYKTAKADFRKAAKTVKYGGEAAAGLGALAGWELGAGAGHWIPAYVGMRLGRSLGKPVVRWLVEHPNIVP